MLKNQPTNLLGTPSHPVHPGPTPAGEWQPPRAAPGPAASAAGLPLLMVRIAVDTAGRESLYVTLSKPLVGRAGLGMGAPVEVVPPRHTGGTWHLDARPTAASCLSDRPGAVARFTSSHKVRRDLFIVPLVGAGAASVLDALTFELGQMVADGYYELRPAQTSGPALGRPVAMEFAKAKQMHQGGMSISEVAQGLGVDRETVYRTFRRHEYDWQALKKE